MRADESMRQVRAPVAIEEVEDVVPRRLRARAERRPRHRRDRRERRLQPAVRCPSRQRAEVRQHAFRHEPIGERRILAVEADDDEPPDLRAAAAAPPRSRRQSSRNGQNSSEASAASDAS